MNEERRRRELGALLRSRRKLLQPEDFALPCGSRRRTPGLKREEVALLSSVSVSWYTWLEQGRKIQPSRRALSRIAQTLRLSDEERIYISLLAATEMDNGFSSAISRDFISVGSIQRTLDAFTRTPAILYNNRFDVVAANAAARAVHGQDLTSPRNWECNMLWRFFMDPERRQMYPDGESDGGIWNLVEALRMNWAVFPEGKGMEELIDELRSASRAFETMWTKQRVGRVARVSGRFRLKGLAKTMRVQHSRFIVADAAGYAIGALVPADSESTRMLDSYLDRAG